MKIILASKSPRRAELLQMSGYDFEVIPSIYDEAFDPDISVEELVMRHAENKAVEVRERLAVSGERLVDTVVLGIDTVGYLDGRILEKPKDREEAFEMIKFLSGSTHQVFSGICVLDLTMNKKIVQHEVTEVTFANMTDDDINWYLDQGEWIDKSASYAIQGKGSKFVEKVNGDFFNVMGLPLCRFNKILRELRTES